MAEDEPDLTAELDAAEAILFADDLTQAQAEFLAASVDVWREIDRLDSRPEGYHPAAMDVDLRKRERAAWERYRDLLDGAGTSQRRSD